MSNLSCHSTTNFDVDRMDYLRKEIEKREEKRRKLKELILKSNSYLKSNQTDSAEKTSNTTDMLSNANVGDFEG